MWRQIISDNIFETYFLLKILFKTVLIALCLEGTIGWLPSQTHVCRPASVTRWFVQYLAISNNDNLPNCIKISQSSLKINTLISI